MFTRRPRRVAAATGQAPAADEAGTRQDRKRKIWRGLRRPGPWLAFGAVVLVAVGVTYWVTRGPSEASATETITQTVTASLQTLDKSVTASGTITQAVNEDASFAASGTVLSVDVAEGDTVEEGQKLAEIDTLRLDADRLEAAAALAEAKASLASAEDNADGTTASDARILATEKQVEVAAANLDAANANMDDAVLVAPAAGQITSVNVAVGDMVGSSGGSGATGLSGTTGLGEDSSQSSSTAAFTIIGGDSWSIDLGVSDSDLALLEVGGQAEMTVDGVADTVYGVISSLGRVASTSGGSAVFPVSVDITGQTEGLYDGLSASVALIYERRTDVLTVPLSAVQTVDGIAYVDKMVDSVPTRTEVTVGETTGSMVEVTSGLVEGDEVQITIAVSTRSDDSGDSDPAGQFQPTGPGGMGFEDFPSGSGGEGRFPQMGEGGFPQVGGGGLGND
jgi:macrolide-specific efflux system membrane fusion protein